MTKKADRGGLNSSANANKVENCRITNLSPSLNRTLSLSHSTPGENTAVLEVVP